MNKKPKLEKPIDCIICLENLGDENPLECGHYMHMECVKKQFKPECALCRRTLNIEVTGQHPIPFVPHDEEQNQPFGYDFWRRVTIIPFTPENNPVRDRVIEHGFEEDTDSLPDLEDTDSHLPCLEDSEDEDGHNNWKKRGYTYREEDDEYDEENPLGDDWEYEDV